jgi:TonB-linked SusC/RagA family outer membrane protein
MILKSIVHTYKNKYDKKTFCFLFLFLFVFSVLQLPAQSQSVYKQKIQLDNSMISIRELFKTIEKQTDYLFFYVNADISGINVQPPVNKTVGETLDAALKATNLSYTVHDRNITISKKKEQPQQKSSVTTNISGVVKSSDNNPIIGSTVAVKNSSIGTITDIEGKFSLNVPSNAVLIISFLGYETQEVEVNNKTIFQIVLKEKDYKLDEVVVIGYGTVKRRDITGSVASVQGDVIQSIPVANVQEAITGKLSGVQVVTTEGSPDAEVKIRIRGGGSITGDNTPLYIVDGFPVSSISDISPADIESIDVLKDASSTAIYGSRGANGVILVTTKEGKSGKVKVSYNTYFGVKKLRKKLNVLSIPDYLNWQYELTSLKNSTDKTEYEKYFGMYEDRDLFDGLVGNDWQDLIYGRTGHVWNNSLSINGGTDKLRYAFNLSRVDDKAIMVGSDFTRNNFSLKLSNKASSKIDINLNVRYSDSKVNGSGMNETNPRSPQDARLKHAIIYTQIPLKQIGSNELDEEELASMLVNPFIAITDNERNYSKNGLNIAGGISWKIIPDLVLKSDVGVDINNSRDNRFYGLSTYYAKNEPANENKNKPAIIITQNNRKTLRNTNTLNYNFEKILNSKDHRLNLLLGHEMLKTESSNFKNTVHGFPVTFISEDAFNLTTQGIPYSIDYYLNPDDLLLSFFSRANYNFKEKYLLTATFRADASGKFSAANAWGYFPSVAGAWRMSGENFMSQTKDWLSDLKIRVSYGMAGNNNIPNGQIEQLFVSNTTNYIYYTTNFLAPAKTMANPNLKWETTHTRNVGLDFALFNSKLNGSFEFYLNNTTDLLIRFPVGGTGYDNQYRNMGETENKGYEVQLSYAAINTKDVGLNFSFNIGFNKNRIKSLGMMDNFGASSDWTSNLGVDYWVAVGGSVGEMYGYVSDGRYELSDFEGYDVATKKWILREGVVSSIKITDALLRPGTMKLKDLTDDGEVTDLDRTVIGNSNPIHTGGFTINARLHNFDLSALFNWSYGNDIYNANKIQFTTTSYYSYRNMLDDMKAGSRWTNLTPEGAISNDMAVLAELNSNTTLWSPYQKNYVFSDWAVEDGSFLRLNTLTLGYTFSKNTIKMLKVNQLRLYAACYNVFMLTNYSGFDPEVSTRRSTPMTPGVDYSAYPRSRQFLMGLNLNF